MIRALLLLFLIDFSLGDPLEVQVANGRLRGRQATNVHGKKYYSFQKIPYALPPLANLRFKAPVPARKWTGVLDVSGTMNLVCHQTFGDPNEETEDCLYLNVYTPQLPATGTNVSLPVMYWIYGGGFTAGSATQGSYGPDYLLDNDVIVVSVSYRLGPLGFLSTGDENIPGNAGLKDQLLGLKWTHENIAAFGGDPKRITIFGESAGAVSVSYHLLNTKAQGLFAGAILESGSSLMPCCMTKNPKDIAFDTAAFLDARFKTNRDTKELLTFLQGVKPRDLDQAAQRYSQRETTAERQLYHGYYYAPTIEPNLPDAIISEKMYVKFKKGDFVRVPVIIGLNSEENLMFEPSNAQSYKSLLNQYDSNLNWLVPVDMRVNDRTKALDLGAKVRQIYTGTNPLSSNLGAAVRFGSDNCFNRGIIKQAELQSNFVPVYFYQLSYNGISLGHTSQHYDGADYVAHAADLNFVFNRGNINSYPEADRNTQKRIQKLWTDFAKFQNPTPQSSPILQNVIWSTPNLKNGSDFNYLDINTNLQLKKDPKGTTYGKWNDLYKSLGYDDFDTY